MNNKVQIEVPIDITFNMEVLLEDIIKEAKENGCKYQDEVEEYIENGNVSVKVLFKNIIKNFFYVRFSNLDVTFFCFWVFFKSRMSK